MSRSLQEEWECVLAQKWRAAAAGRLASDLYDMMENGNDGMMDSPFAVCFLNFLFIFSTSYLSFILDSYLPALIAPFFHSNKINFHMRASKKFWSKKLIAADISSWDLKPDKLQLFWLITVRSPFLHYTRCLRSENATLW